MSPLAKANELYSRQGEIAKASIDESHDVEGIFEQLKSDEKLRKEYIKFKAALVSIAAFYYKKNRIDAAKLHETLEKVMGTQEEVANILSIGDFDWEQNFLKVAFMEGLPTKEGTQGFLARSERGIISSVINGADDIRDTQDTTAEFELDIAHFKQIFDNFRKIVKNLENGLAGAQATRGMVEEVKGNVTKVKF
ncbi:MAG: hypothetical protein N4A38_02110 [Candidatus Gracilibacteria bacterium]|nr:hypothetical protein [Candidatus Gracilibacteria bacterium]